MRGFLLGLLAGVALTIVGAQFIDIQSTREGAEAGAQRDYVLTVRFGRETGTGDRVVLPSTGGNDIEQINPGGNEAEGSTAEIASLTTPTTAPQSCPPFAEVGEGYHPGWEAFGGSVNDDNLIRNSVSKLLDVRIKLDDGSDKKTARDLIECVYQSQVDGVDVGTYSIRAYRNVSRDRTPNDVSSGNPWDEIDSADGTDWECVGEATECKWEEEAPTP